MNTRESFRKTLMTTSAALLAVAAGLAAAVQSQALAADKTHLQSAIAFSSSRDDPDAKPGEELFNAAEIYLIDPDGSNPRRLTNNADGDGFAALSPDGKKIVFDSNRLRDDQCEPPPSNSLNTSDLFVMEVPEALDALDRELHLVRGSSATWSPDGKYIAYHASASGCGTAIDTTPGAATTDSDIFVLNVGDVLAGFVGEFNLTEDHKVPHSDKLAIDSDADWSPVLADGKEKIVFTSHSVEDAQDDQPLVRDSAEIYVMNADGSSLEPERLTFNDEEERGPAWSPDGSRIVYACRIFDPRIPFPRPSDFEICVMNANATGVVHKLTDNQVPDLTPTWSPDGMQIVFHRFITTANGQLFVMNADGTVYPDGKLEHQITFPPGANVLANWGEVRNWGQGE